MLRPIMLRSFDSERGRCKVRYCAKFVSEVKINDSPVNKEWVEFPVGARMDLLANVAEVSAESSRSWLGYTCCFVWIDASLCL